MFLFNSSNNKNFTAENIRIEKVKNDSGAINFVINYVEQFVIGH